MNVKTIHISDEKMKLLNEIADYEHNSVDKVLESIIEDYLSIYRESMEIMQDKNSINSIEKGLAETKNKETVSNEDVKRLFDVED